MEYWAKFGGYNKIKVIWAGNDGRKDGIIECGVVLYSMLLQALLILKITLLIWLGKNENTQNSTRFSHCGE